MRKCLILIVLILPTLASLRVNASEPSATQEPVAAAVEEPSAAQEPSATINQTVVMKTNFGDVTIELLFDAAPKTSAHFLELATGAKPWRDPQSGEEVNRPLYDGLTFHRVMDNFMIQGGDPLGTGRGGPGFRIPDEIDADALGLDKLTALDLKRGHMHPYFEISWPQFRQRVLLRGINPGLPDASARVEQAMQKWDGASLKDAYEALGYRYLRGLPSQPVKRGTLAMANSGPNTNGSQFFISVRDNEYLNGKHTVFGVVVDGMDVVDAIAKVPVSNGSSPQQPVVIESIRPAVTSAVPAQD